MFDDKNEDMHVEVQIMTELDYLIFIRLNNNNKCLSTSDDI